MMSASGTNLGTPGVDPSLAEAAWELASPFGEQPPPSPVLPPSTRLSLGRFDDPTEAGISSRDALNLIPGSALRIDMKSLASKLGGAGWTTSPASEGAPAD